MKKWIYDDFCQLVLLTLHIWTLACGFGKTKHQLQQLLDKIGWIFYLKRSKGTRRCKPKRIETGIKVLKLGSEWSGQMETKQQGVGGSRRQGKGSPGDEAGYTPSYDDETDWRICWPINIVYLCPIKKIQKIICKIKFKKDKSQNYLSKWGASRKAQDRGD